MDGVADAGGGYVSVARLWIVGFSRGFPCCCTAIGPSSAVRDG